MNDILPPRILHDAKIYAKMGRAEIEAGLRPRAHKTEQFYKGIVYAIGSCAVGCLAAGIAVFLTAVVLNLLFHFSPL